MPQQKPAPQTVLLVGAPRRRPSLGAVSGAAGLGILAVAALIPPDFVTEGPGPVFNTLGAYDSQELVTVEGARTYPTDGELDMTTVYVAGGPNGATSSLAVLNAYLDPAHTAYPAAALYSPATTSEQVSSQNSAQMTSSQSAAQAAAAKHLGVEYTTTLTVTGTTEQTVVPQLETGDVLTALDGQELTDYQALTEALARSKGAPVELTYRPGGDGDEKTVSVTPRHDEENDKYVLGVYLQPEYDFPFTVHYGLESVGGPSAGTMFALGIVDKMTEGSMTGGKHFAGTGTIDEAGDVGAIGGIRQKMVGARDAGAEVFLAPGANCDEVVGHVPDGLAVVEVDTLDEAVDAVQGIGSGKDPADYPQCGD